jgi:hypothetical protein
LRKELHLAAVFLSKLFDRLRSVTRLQRIVIVNLCVITLTLWCFCPAYGQEKSPEAHEKKKPSQDAVEPVVPPEPRVVINENTAEVQSNRSEDHPDSYLRKLISPESLPNLILCLVGIAGVIVAVFTVKYIATQARIMRHQSILLRHQVRASIKTVEVANMSIEMSISKQRARLRVEISPLDMADKVGDTHMVRLVIAMYGDSSAFITDSGASAYCLPKNAVDVEGVAEAVMFPIHNLPSTIATNSPSINTYAFLFIDKDAYAEIISEIESGQMAIGIRGFIKYTDVFDKRRETSFRYSWSLEGGPLAGFGITNKLSEGDWVKSGPPEDNQET